MARKTNHTKAKPRPKSGRRKDYTRETSLSLRSLEAIFLAKEQRFEILTNRMKDREAEIRRSFDKQAAHRARHGAKA